MVLTSSTCSVTEPLEEDLRGVVVPLDREVHGGVDVGGDRGLPIQAERHCLLGALKVALGAFRLGIATDPPTSWMKARNIACSCSSAAWPEEDLASSVTLRVEPARHLRY